MLPGGFLPFLLWTYDDDRLDHIMRIAFVTQPWDVPLPSMGGPGSSIDIWTYEIGSRLAQAGHDVIVYCPGTRFGLRRHTEEGRGMQFRAMSGVRIERRLMQYAERLFTGSNPLDPFYISRWYHRAYAEQVARDLKQNPCDIVQISNLISFAPVIRRQNPQSCLLMNMQCFWLSQLDYDRLAEYLTSVDAVTGCSRAVAEGAGKRFPSLDGRSFPVLNGVDVQHFFREPSSERSVDSKTVVFIGRVSPEKGVHDLIQAFTAVHARFPDARLKIIGGNYPADKSFIVDVSDEPTVKELAFYYDTQRMNAPTYYDYLQGLVPPEMRDNVEFTGPLPHHTIVDHLQDAAVFALPSLSEALGIPIVEAMACGVPTVTTCAGGMPEVTLNGETGYIVPPAQPERLATAIIKLLGDQSLRQRMGEAGQRHAAENFTWDKAAETIMQCYEVVLS